MAIEIQGINKLINKLTKISKIEAKEIVQEVAKDLETSIIKEARSFSDSEYKCIKQCEVRDYGTSCFVDIGLRNDEVSFDEWRGLWFHQWGYTHWRSGNMITPHVLWFDNAVNSVGNSITEKLKVKVRKEIREFNK